MEPQRSPSLRINHFEKQQQNEHGTQRHKRNPKYELLNCAKKFWISKGLTENEEFPNESVLTNTARFPHYELRKTTRGAVKRSTRRQTRRTSTPTKVPRREAKASGDHHDAAAGVPARSVNLLHGFTPAKTPRQQNQQRRSTKNTEDQPTARPKSLGQNLSMFRKPRSNSTSRTESAPRPGEAASSNI